MSDIRVSTLKMQLQLNELHLIQAIDEHADDIKQMLRVSFVNAMADLQTQMDNEIAKTLQKVFSFAIQQAAERVGESMSDEIAAAMTDSVRALVEQHMKGTKA